MTTDQFETDIIPLKHPIYRFALYLLKNKEDARDLAQDVLINMWEKRDQLNHVENQRAWAMKLTRNRCYDFLKSPKRKGVAWNETLDRTSESTAINELESSEETRWIKKELKKLPEIQRDIFYLRHFEEQTYQEIGEQLNIDQNRVKVYLHRARVYMKEQLEKRHAYGLQTG
jgi:RNA polymerase sigma factor (sigma-70 family)